MVDYISYLHYDVIRKLSSLFDIILEVPEGTFWSLCKVTPDVPDDSAGGFARAMLYNPMPEEDEKKTANTWLRGHSDASFLTFITSQPMASRQVRDYKDGQWKWVGYRENALVVNVADCLEFLSGSYFKSTIHRVVSPPDDQKGHRRLGFSESRDSLSCFVCGFDELTNALLDSTQSTFPRSSHTLSSIRVRSSLPNSTDSGSPNRLRGTGSPLGSGKTARSRRLGRRLSTPMRATNRFRSISTVERRSGGTSSASRWVLNCNIYSLSPEEVLSLLCSA